MKIGFGIHGPRLTDQTLRFARQIGVSDVVAHLVGGRPTDSIEKLLSAPGFTTYRDDPRYTLDGLTAVKAQIESHGLRLFAVENFEPADWYDVLLDGPRRDEQMVTVSRIVQHLGQLQVPTMGYNFSIAGVWGRPDTPSARGGAMSATFSHTPQTPIPKGMVWNAVYDQELYEHSSRTGDYLDPISVDQLWDRYARFLREIVPVAEQAGVVMALHPDDPPLETLRGTPRLVWRGELYERVLGIVDSPNNAMEFCVGTLSEMPDQDIYEIVERFVATGRIQYVHLRNVVGRVPDYREAFIDEGYVDLQRILGILRDGGFDGVVIPDHTPHPDTSSSWETGMAYAVGWIRASLRSLKALDDD
jgi:mannonate dehydratase